MKNRFLLAAILPFIFVSCSSSEKGFVAKCRTVLDSQMQEAKVNTGDYAKLSDYKKIDYKDENGVKVYFGTFQSEGRGGLQEVRWMCSAEGEQPPLVTITKVTDK